MGGEDVELEREFVAYPDSRIVLRLDNKKTFLRSFTFISLLLSSPFQHTK